MGTVAGSDLKYRAASAVVLVPVVLGLTWLGGWAFALMWTLAGLAMLHEWACMVRLERRTLWLGMSGVALACAAALTWLGLPAYGVGLCAAAALAGAALVPEKRLWAVLGMAVAACVTLSVIALRGDVSALGMVAIFYLYAVVWATDIFAYFTGRALGGPKLWPRVSPNKTWSGAIGGVVFAALAGGLVAWAANLPNIALLVGLTLVLSVVSQAGDLAESAAKRLFGVKDSGCLIPGHGGLLDRLDGFTVAVLVAALIGVARMGADPAAGLLLW